MYNYKFNYEQVNNMINNSSKSKRQVAENLMLPEKFFSKLHPDGSNISAEKVARIANYFNCDISSLYIDYEEVKNKAIIKIGRSIFGEYDDIDSKLQNLEIPSYDNYKSPQSDSIRVQTSSISSPQISYILSAEKYQVLKTKKQILDFVLNQVVCDLNTSKETKKKIRDDLMHHLAFSIDYWMVSTDRELLSSLANKACTAVVYQYELTNLLSDEQKHKLQEIMKGGR